MQRTWTCRCCGKQLSELPLDVALNVPDPWLDIPVEERSVRGKIDSDRCIIGNEFFFIRGCLEIPVTDHDGPFIWGVWVSLAKPNFERILDLWNEQLREDEPPMFGWLCNRIRGYPETYALKTNIYLRNNNKRPFIELEQTDHPLAVEQCRLQGGNKCVVRLAYYNQCAAIADPGTTAGNITGGVSIAARAETLQLAKENGLRDCRAANNGTSCVISYSACSMSEFKSF